MGPSLIAILSLAAVGSVPTTLPARDTADVLARGRWSVGIVDPLRIGVHEGLEVSTHPILTLLLSPNVEARVALRTGALRVTGEYGVSVPSVAMRLTSGYLFPTWGKSDHRVGWFLVPSAGVAISAGERTTWTGRFDTAIGIPIGRNDATPLDTFAPLELLFAPALTGLRHHASTFVDRAVVDWLRVRVGLDAWMMGPSEPPKSPLVFATRAGGDLRLSRSLRLSLGLIVYDSDQHRQVVERGEDRRFRRERVRSLDVYPTFDLVFTHW